MITNGMREVTKDEFFATVGPMNVHPSIVSPSHTSWETPLRKVIGVSFPGWKNPGDPKRYFLNGRA